MKFIDTPVLKQRQARTCVWLSGVVVALLIGSGCSQAPEASTPATAQQAMDAQIKDIQNNPNMSEMSKQQAIAGMKAQQSQGAK